MRLSELNPNEICSVFDRAASINISYSWLGSPSVSIQANGQEYLDELSALEEIAVRAIRNKHSAETPRALIETAYLVNKISQFQEMSKQEIENANCISRLFYRIRHFFIDFCEMDRVFQRRYRSIHDILSCDAYASRTAEWICEPISPRSL